MRERVVETTHGTRRFAYFQTVYAVTYTVRALQSFDDVVKVAGFLVDISYLLDKKMK